MADIRVCFSKMGQLQYISHLDLQRAIARMLIRTNLPLGYSEGFNPHPRLNIALPLSIYQEGEREWFDFRLTEDIPLEAVKERLQGAAFPGMDIIEVSLAVGKLTTKTAIWRLELETDMPAEELAKKVSGEMPVTKRSKKGDKIVDISPMVKFISAERDGGVLVARFELNAAGNDYLNPAYVAAFLGEDVKLIRTVRENIIF